VNGTKISCWALLALVAAASMPPSTARAGGFEVPGAGTRGNGRGGAFAARADDPQALRYNPANLAALPGIQLSLDVNLMFYGACFNRSNTYGESWGLDGADVFYGAPGPIPGSDGMSEVCNSGPMNLAPSLMFTWRLTPELGIGVGFLPPNAIGHTVFGRPSDGTITSSTTLNGRIPAPGRYGLVEEQLLQAFPSIGVGYSITPQVRVGATFGSGFGIFDFTNYTRIDVGESFAGDIRSELHASDWFIPRLTGSVHLVPHDNLDVMLSFSWQDDISAEGTVKLIAGSYAEDPAASAEVLLDGATLEVPSPWQASVGVRYADRISPRPRDPGAISRLSGRIEDPMANERWDVELDVVYEMNSRVDAFTLTLPPGYMLGPYAVPSDPILLRHNWKDQLSFRLGGDYNVIPGMAAVRAGVSYETNGIENGWTQTDFMPFARLGLHAGLTLRLGKLDINLAYAHIHQFEVEVTNGEMRPVYALPPTSFSGVATINSGTYTSNVDILSLGVNYHFQ